MGKIYPFGYNDAAVNIMKTRTAQDNAKLFLNYAKPNMHILDVGCGPGSITIGLAQALPDCHIIGIDKEGSQLDIASEAALQHKVVNCSFEQASIFELPYENDSFDAVYGHTILMHFKEVEAALAEIRRVLKPGGYISFREVDFGSNIFYPSDSALAEVMGLFRRSFFHNDANPDLGRSLAHLLEQNGFSVKEFNISMSQATTLAQKEGMYQSMVSLWQQAEFPAQAVELGWITQDQRDAIPAQLTTEASQSHTLNSTCYVEVVATLT